MTMPAFGVEPDLLALKAAYDIAAREERDAMDALIEAGQGVHTPAGKYAAALAQQRLRNARARKSALYGQILGGNAGLG
jgi:hypothetical protein